MKQIFLSAGIPSPNDHPYGDTADPLLIDSAVRSLCSLVFGHRKIVWGGHPAITPMMWAACENLSVNYADTVHLYQSRFFEEAFPEENLLFKNVTYVDPGPDRNTSLRLLRDAMMQNEFEAGVFIGGKEGILAEFQLFRDSHPQSTAIVFPTTGGAARQLGQIAPNESAPADDFIDFLAYMAERIVIDKPPSKPTGRATKRPR